MQDPQTIKVLCLGKLPQAQLDALKSTTNPAFELEIIDRSGPLSSEEMIVALASKDAVLTEPQDRIDAAALASAPALRFVGQRAVGFDNLDIKHFNERSPHKILATNTPGVLDNATADLAFALLIAVARRVVEADTYVKSGQWSGFENNLLLGTEITGKTIGIIGLGRIGLAMARRAHGFGMRILYMRSGTGRGNDDFAADQKDLMLKDELGAERVKLDRLLQESDFISLHCPYTPLTDKLLSTREFGLIKPSCILVNTSRGRVIDEMAMVDALKAGKIHGLGLDVLEKEPAVPQAFIEAPNVVLAPHIGSATHETRGAMAALAVRGMMEAFSGTRPQNAINGEIWTDWQKQAKGE